MPSGGKNERRFLSNLRRNPLAARAGDFLQASMLLKRRDIDDDSLEVLVI
jgi:hypothetical protein